MTGSPIWHPFTQHALEPEMLPVSGADGAWLETADGRRIFDGISSWWVITHGHRHPKIIAAIVEQAAKHEGLEIDLKKLDPFSLPTPLVIEPAGGLAVPLTRRTLQIDLMAEWKLPVILCSATRLGTINHSLLSIEALKHRAIPILGVAFIGAENADSERTIALLGGVKRLGRLPWLSHIDAPSLGKAFAENFDVANILGLGSTGP